MQSATGAALSAMVIGDALGSVPVGVQVLVLVLMAGCAVWAAVRLVPAAVVAFLACAILWSRANQALEGPILWTFTPDHGLTTADLWPPLLSMPILWRWYRCRWFVGRAA